MLNEHFVYLGLILSSIGGLSYLLATVKGAVQPNKVTWFLWALTTLITFAAEVQQGVGVQAWVTFGAGIIPLLVFIASFLNKRAYWSIRRLDIVAGVLSLVGIVVWRLSQTGDIAIVANLTANFLASFPTILKAYQHPESENPRAYALGASAGLVTLLTISTWNFATYAFPANLFLVNGFIALLARRPAKAALREV